MDKKEFIESLREELRRGGIIRAITSQLKEEICSSYLRTCRPPHLHAVKQKSKIQSLEHIALRSLILDYLIYDDLQLTLSVYSTESGLNHDNHHSTTSAGCCSFMSAADICKAFEIKRESKLFKMMTTSKMNDKSHRVEHSMISKILSGIPSLINNDVSYVCTATQTHGDDENHSILLARRDLEDRLQQIKDKYAQQSELLSQSYRSNSESLESQMFAFQRECEERERTRMERELEVYKKTALEAIKREVSEKCSLKIDESKRTLKAEYDRNLEQLKMKEEKLREEFLVREKEREKEHLADLHRLMREIEHFKKRESDNKSALDVQWRKLELEEQRVKNILLTAEMKLNFAETKEKEVRESITNEYNRVRLTAKQSYDDASDSVKKQMEFYAAEFDRINALRKENENRLMAHEALEIESSRLRVENAELKTNLDAAMAKLESLKLSKEEVEKRGSDKVQLLQNEIDVLRNELRMAQELSTQNKHEVARVNKMYERTKENFEQRCKSLKLDLLNAEQEKQVLQEQVHELQKLLCRSEGALRNVHVHHQEEAGERNLDEGRRTKQGHILGGDIQAHARRSHFPPNFLVDTLTTKDMTARKQLVHKSGGGINSCSTDLLASSVTKFNPKEHIQDGLIQEETNYFDTCLLVKETKAKNHLQVTAGQTSHNNCSSIISHYQHQNSSDILNNDFVTQGSPPIGMIIDPKYEIRHDSAEEKIVVDVGGLCSTTSTNNNSSTSICLLKCNESRQHTHTNHSLDSLDRTTRTGGKDPNHDSLKTHQKQERQRHSVCSSKNLPISCTEETRQDPSTLNGEDTYKMLEVEEKDDENYPSDFEIESITVV